MNASPTDRTVRLQPTESGPAPRSLPKARKYRSSRDQLTEAQRELASQFVPLARGMSKPLKILYPYWKDEFESAACLALVEAARSFDPSRNIRFATFARFRIKGALRDVGRSMILPGFEDEESSPGTVALTPYNEEHGTVLVASEPPEVGLDVDDIDEVEHWLRKLPKRHATICRLYYLYGKTQSEIAAVFGCSQSEITRLHKKSIDLLSEPYAADPLENQSTWKRKRPRRTFEVAKPQSPTKFG